MAEQLKIEDLKDGLDGVSFKAMLVDKQLLEKKIRGTYWLQLTMGDNTGTITFPVWNRSEEKFEEYSTNKVYCVTGDIGSYEDKLQVLKPRLEPVDKEDIDINDYVQTFEISDDMLAYFNGIVENLGTYSPLVAKALELVGIDNFLIAPAAVSHHHNKLSGLFYHTLGLLRMSEKVAEVYTCADINLKRLQAKIVLHDMKKVYEYEYPLIKYNEDSVLDHLIMGVQLVTEANSKLSVKEALDQTEIDSICYGLMSHHGQYGGYQPKTAEDQLLHQLDMIDSRLITQLDNYKIGTPSISKREENTVSKLIRAKLEELGE